MRKNGINRELVPIDGGVCAPQGFQAGGIYCGILPPTLMGNNAPREDLGLIVADNRYPAACVYTSGGLAGAPVRVCKKHCTLALARAVIVNSGIANMFGENGEMQAEYICRAVAQKFKTSSDEILIASTGKTNERFPFDLIVNSIDDLAKNLGYSHENSLAAARAMMTTDSHPKQISYSFHIGDYSCKIGAIFKGSNHVSPNMATTLCFLTTDVNVSAEMLQRALRSAVNDTFNMLTIDGVSSPNDTVCIISSRKAENYRISCADSEYQKFEYALKETLFKICEQIASDGAFSKKSIVYYVRGAKSKSSARTIAKTLAGAIGLKKSFYQGYVSLSDVVCAISGGEASTDVSRLQFTVSSGKKSLVLIEEGEFLAYSKEHLRSILSGKKVSVTLDFQDGNYAARSIGCDLI